MNKNFLPAFTMIEILTAIAVVALLSTAVSVALGPVSDKTRDNRRLKDLDNIRSALNLYKQETGFFPPSLPAGQPLVGPSGRVYLQAVPSNVSDGDCQGDYQYSQQSNGFTYSLRYCLASKMDNIGPGYCSATPGSLCCEPSCAGKCGGDDGCGNTCQNTCSGATPYCSDDGSTCLTYADCPAAVCGDCSALAAECNNLTSGQTSSGSCTTPDGTVYRAIKVASQCWLDKNINVGTMDTGHTAAAANAADGIKKYCYQDDAAKCQLFGGLYTWSMAMHLPATYNSSLFKNYTGTAGTAAARRRGICPVGWHVPSDYDWSLLEYNTGDTALLDPRSNNNPAVCANANHSWYADTFNSGGTTGCTNTTLYTGYRGTGSNWSSGVAAKLLCTGFEDMSGVWAYQYCTNQSYPASYPRFPLGGAWYSSAFRNAEVTAYMLSSSQYDLWKPWRRSFAMGQTAAYRYYNFSKSDAQSLRCLKD